jgi:hypothetical protein
MFEHIITAQDRLDIMSLISVSNELLPKGYHGSNGCNNLATVEKKYQKNQANKKNRFDIARGTSLKFDSKQNLTDGTPERLAAVESYHQQIASGQEITYHTPSERRLNNAQIAFFNVLVKTGVIQDE